MTPNVKPYLSKTIWMNVILGVLVAVAPLLAPASHYADVIKASAPTIGLVWSVLGIGIRLITKGSISLEE